MSGGAGRHVEKSNFLLIQGHLNLPRDRAVSKTCLRDFMTQNGQLCPNPADRDGKDEWGRSGIHFEDHPMVSRSL